MNLRTKGRYAVMAMVELAARGHGKPVCLADLSESQEIPLPYLEQIFAKLRRQGLVQSSKGPGGGYMLAHPASDIRISSIVEAVDEPIKMTRCESHSEGGCMSSKARCLTHDLWEGLGEQIYSYLHSISLQDICNRQIRKQPAPRVAGVNQVTLL